MPRPLPISGKSLLVRGPRLDIREGTSHTPRHRCDRNLPSLADAVACYERTGYQAAKDIGRRFRMAILVTRPKG